MFIPVICFLVIFLIIWFGASKNFAAIAADNVNIDGLMNKRRGAYAYTMLDFDQHPSEAVVEHLKQVEGVLRVRVIK